MTNEEIIKNLVAKRNRELEAKAKEKTKKLFDFIEKIHACEPLIKELIRAGNLLLENNIDIQNGCTDYNSGDFFADGYTHKFGYRRIQGEERITQVGRSLGDNDEYYHIYTDGNEIDIGAKTFRYDSAYDDVPRNWLRELLNFRDALVEKFGLNFDDLC